MTSNEQAATPPEWLNGFASDAQGSDLERDVIGLRAARDEVRSLIARIRWPERILEAGGDLPRAVLLYGEPGCGKSLLARCASAELTRAFGSGVFYSVPATEMTASKWNELSRWLGRRSPIDPICVIYVDEIDTFALNRHTASDRSRAVLLGALACLDGIDDSSRNRALFLFSSNVPPQLMDTALMRAGRAGTHIKVSYPSHDDRVEILRHYAGTRRCEDGIDWDRASRMLGSRTSPALCRAVLDDALAIAMADAGGDAIVTWNALSKAIARRGDVRDRKPLTDEETYRTAVHESGHAVASRALGYPIAAMTLVHEERSSGGFTDHGDDNEHDETTEGYMRDQVAIALAGLAAESIVLGGRSIGGQPDLSSATNAAKRIVESGADTATRPVDFGYFLEHSEAAADEQFRAVAAICAESMTRALTIIAERRSDVVRLAQQLAASGHLSGLDLQAAFRAARCADVPGPEIEIRIPPRMTIEGEFGAPGGTPRGLAGVLRRDDPISEEVDWP